MSLLVHQLAERHFAGVPRALREQIVAFYQNGTEPTRSKKDRKDWAKVQAELQALKGN
jgi:hypothetical protein